MKAENDSVCVETSYSVRTIIIMRLIIALKINNKS